MAFARPEVRYDSCMRLYISSPSGQPTNLPRHLQRVARLYRAGALHDTSRVWINARLNLPVFWTLSWRSTCMFWHDAPTSGTVRLTKDRIRWAPTYNLSGSKPDIDIDLGALNLESMKHVTFVVDHGHTSEPVQVVENSETKYVEGGFYQGANAAVLDLGAFRGPAVENAPARPRFAASLADVHGTNLLTAGMSRAEAENLEERMESYGIDLDPQTLSILAGSIESFEAVSASMMGAITAQSGL